MLRLLLRLLCCVGLTWAASTTLADEPANVMPSLDAYGRLPAIELTRLSPSGADLAMITVVHDQRSLVVRDTTRKGLLTMTVGTVKVRNLEWADEDHLLVTVSRTQLISGTTGRAEYPFTLSINVRTGANIGIFAKDSRLLPYTFAYYGAYARNGHTQGLFAGSIVSRTRGDSTAAYWGSSGYGIFNVDLDSGMAEPLVHSEARSIRWVLGPDHKVMAHWDYDQLTGRSRLIADNQHDKVLRESKDALAEYQLIGAGRQPGSLVAGGWTVDEWSPGSDVSHPLPVEGDVDGFDYDRSHQRLLAVHLGGEDAHVQVFDPVFAARFADVRKALRGRLSPVSWSDDYSRLIVFAEGDGDAGTFWLVDGKSANPIGYAYPDLADAVVAPVSVITYKAGDGIGIHAILTLPVGRAAKGLPLVVLPHGGPEGHDSLEFSWWAQAFASRGYAVLQPNFRGSNGHGRDFRNAGFGQWGRKMQSDISDGVAALAAQGVIDAKRACIVGASYGGYAALAGVTVQQGIYRCAVSVNGISDLNYLLREGTRLSGDDDRTAGGRYMKQFLGVRTDEAGVLHDLSPAKLAARADAPILLIQSANDTVVPLGQTREMESALKRAGKPVEFLLLPSDDHWLSLETTRKSMLVAAVAFVQKYNPAP